LRGPVGLQPALRTSNVLVVIHGLITSGPPARLPFGRDRQGPKKAVIAATRSPCPKRSPQGRKPTVGVEQVRPQLAWPAAVHVARADRRLLSPLQNARSRPSCALPGAEHRLHRCPIGIHPQLGKSVAYAGRLYQAAAPAVGRFDMIWIFVVGACAACPIAFSGLWTRTWFRICVYLGLFIALGHVLQQMLAGGHR
jgi:hypothetical protein